MSRKTFKRLMILIAVFSLVGGVGYFVLRFQVDRMARGMVEQADRAVEQKEYAKAVELYQEHLLVVPDDVEVQIKYADILIDQGKSQKHYDDAMSILRDILRRQPGREDVRRRAAELAVKMGGTQFEVARLHLRSLLKNTKDDGHLEYLMGRCYEQDRDAATAANYYRSAIAHGAAERLDAAQRVAALLRDPLGQPEEADRVIEEMVQSDPKNYQVYLERGRYRRRFNLEGAGEDFQKSLEIAPDQPEIYLAAAALAERKSGPDAARQVLEKGLAATPLSPALYLALADLERRAGRMDQSIEVMERGLEKMPDQVPIRMQLAWILAARGDTSKLYLHIQEMKNNEVNQILVDYFTAYYHVNRNEFAKARQILASLQPLVAHHGDFKSRVSVLLARCYGQLGEPELQWDANQRAVAANPDDLQAKLAWIQGLVNRGDLNGAIEQYRRIVDQVPQVRLRLAQYLIVRNQQLPLNQRSWGEAEGLLKKAIDAEPKSAEPVVLQAALFAVQGDMAKGLKALETARSRFPQASEPWTTEAQLLLQEKRYDQALSVLDRARKTLGDRVEFRLSRARIWVRKGGPTALAALNSLGDDLESFSKESRRNLLAILATELAHQSDLQGAARMWSRLAELDPESLDPHLNLYTLASQAADPATIEKEIEAIGKLDPLHGRYCQADYLIWQAGRAQDPAERERLRTDARALLTNLKTRRPDWAPIPLSMAKMEEQELVQGGLDEAQLREKQETLITMYLKAIDLGARDPTVLRRAVRLLFAASRGSEALELMSRVPSVSQFVELGRLASRYAVENRDFRQAEEIARNAVKARPDDFQERIWLIRVLLESGRGSEAEAEVRKAVAEVKTDPNRWIALVDVLRLIGRLEEAELAIRDAEANLPQAPLALAQCCENLGRSYQSKANKTDQAKKWYDQARQWFVKAQAGRKDPNDVTIDRQLAAFYLRTNQIDEAQKQLSEILGRKDGTQAKTTVAWARRNLALTYIAGNPRQPAKALALMETVGRQDGADDPEDMRILARVLEAQGTPEHRKRAIDVLNTLVNQNLANPEDRYILAQIEDAAGDWPKARAQYRELILRTNNVTDLETNQQRQVYLAKFTDRLLYHHQANEVLDLAEVQELIEKLKQIQPDLLAVLVLEVRLDKLRNQNEAARDRIRSTIDRPNLSPEVRVRLAELAEQIDEFELAERIYRRIAAEPATVPNQVKLVHFLVRHKKLDAAIEFCASLWEQKGDHDGAARLSIMLFTDPNIPASPAQIERGVGWLQQVIRENPRSSLFRFGLGNLYERLGEDEKAEEQYRAVINIDDRQGTASNNLAWLMALRGDSSDALVLINKAIQVQGAHPDFLDTRGVVYLSAGQGPSAVKDLEAAVAAQPTAPKLFHLTQAYLKVQQPEKAKKSWEAANRQGLPKGLHKLEMAAYQKVLNELGKP